MKEATVSLAHPILFVMDFGNPKVEIPRYSDETIISTTSSCVSVRVIADVDGDVRVRLLTGAQGAPLEGFSCVFEGTVLTPNRKVVVVTAHNERVLETDVAGEVTTVRVSVNNIDFPDNLIIEAF